VPTGRAFVETFFHYKLNLLKISTLHLIDFINPQKGRSGSSSDERGLSSWDGDFLRALHFMVDEEMLARMDEVQL